jgi:hypothetical protein
LTAFSDWTTGDDPSRLIQDLASRSLESHLWTIRQYGELRRRIASGDWDEQWVNEQYADYVTDEGAHYREQLANLGVAYHRGLVDLNRAFSERFYERLERVSGRGPNGPVRPDQVAAPMAMELHGVIGTEAIGVFSLHNGRDVPAAVTFDLGDIYGEGGRLPYRLLRVEPEAPVLPPGGERQIQVRVALIEGLFEAGRRYTATVRVNGHEPVELSLTIRVDPPPVPAAGSGPVETSSEEEPARDRTPAAEPARAPSPAPPKRRRRAPPANERARAADTRSPAGSSAPPESSPPAGSSPGPRPSRRRPPAKG